MDIPTYVLLKKQLNSILPGYSYKGGVSSVDDLPDDATTGDLYTVGRIQYVWNGTEWTDVGMDTINTAQIDALFAEEE